MPLVLFCVFCVLFRSCWAKPRTAAEGRTKLFVSWVSLAEIYYVTYRKSVAEDREVQAKATVEGLKRLAVTIVPAGEVETWKAGHLKARFTLSLADAFVAALGQIHDAQIVTGDPEFKPLEEAHEIRDASPLPQVILSKEATVEVVRAAIAELDTQFREAIVLRELEGLSYKEISEVTGVRIGTVMSRLSRGRNQLALLLSDRKKEDQL